MDIEQKINKTILKILKMWCSRKIENIKWMEMKANDVFDLAKDKITLLSNLRSWRWHMVGLNLRHNEELYIIILKGMIERKRGKGKPRMYK